MSFSINFGTGDLNIYGIAFFCIAGLISGALLRPSIFKIIIALFVIPYFMNLLTQLNNTWEATVPYLICMLLGLLGWQRLRYYLLEIADQIHMRIRR